MPLASNSPRTPLTLQLEQRKSVAFGVSFVDTTGGAIDINGASLRMVMRPWNDTQVDDSTAVLDVAGSVTEPDYGYGRFDIQAADLDLDHGNYTYAIVMESDSGYSSVVVKGAVELLQNTEFTSTASVTLEDEYPAFNIQVMLTTPDPLTQVTGVPGPNQVPFTAAERDLIDQLVNRMDGLETGGVVLKVEGITPDGSGNVDLDIPNHGSLPIVLESGEELPVGLVPPVVIYRITPLVTTLAVDDTTVETASNSVTDLDIGVPANAVAGDYLVATMTSQNGGKTWTAPLGWEAIGELTTDDNRSLYIFGYPVTGTPPVGPVTFTGSGAGRNTGFMVRVEGVDLSDAILVPAVGSTGRTANYVTNLSLTGSNGGLVFSIACGNNSSGLPYPTPAVWSNSMVPFVAEATSPDNTASLTWISAAAATTVIAFNEHTITAQGGVSQMGGAVFALRGV